MDRMRCADSQDGKVVVNHDATLDRTSDRIGKLSALDWAKIKLADIGTEKHPQQYPLLLDELLEMWERNSGYVIIPWFQYDCSPGRLNWQKGS